MQSLSNEMNTPVPVKVLRKKKIIIYMHKISLLTWMAR